MPIYVYAAADGSKVEHECPWGEAPPAVQAKKKVYDKIVQIICAPAGGIEKPVKGNRRGWPIKSDAAGVNPKQIPVAIAADKRLGVPASYTKDGRVIFENREHQRRWLKAHGMRNWDENF